MESITSAAQAAVIESILNETFAQFLLPCGCELFDPLHSWLAKSQELGLKASNPAHGGTSLWWVPQKARNGCWNQLCKAL